MQRAAITNILLYAFTMCMCLCDMCDSREVAGVMNFLWSTVPKSCHWQFLKICTVQIVSWLILFAYVTVHIQAN